jgi:hypothetical protein
LFTKEGNLIFMNNLYHKVAIASVCTALSFTLGANQEAKAATITLAPTVTYGVRDLNDGINSFDGIGDEVLSANFPLVLRGTEGELAQFAEFNIGSFSQIPNISSAIFQAEIFSFRILGLGLNNVTNPGSLALFGYEGNGIPDRSDLETGIFLNSVDISSSSVGDILSFDVSAFVNQRVSSDDAFAGFGIRALNLGGLALGGGYFSGIQPRLVIETANIVEPEPVPEPTTLFGSAIGLCLGGWLKRKKSSRSNKTTPQH